MTLTKRTFRICALILTLVFVTASGAAKATDEEEDGEEIASTGYVEYVEVKDSSLPTSNTIATKLELPLQLTPAMVGTVGAPLIYEQNALVLGDSLENISGLNIQNGSGTIDFFTMRGYDSVSSALIMTDGAAEPEATYYQMYNVRGVEVYKGPAGFLYGKNPLSGAVNIVRKQPTPGTYFSLAGSYGSFNTAEATMDWNLSNQNDTVSFRLNTLWAESDHYRNGMDSSQAAINPSVTWRIGDDSTLNFNLEYVSAEYNPDNGLPLVSNAIPGVNRKTSYQSAADFSDQELNRFQVNYEKKLGENLTLRNKTYYNTLDWRSDGTLLQFTFEANPMTPWLMPGQTQVVRDLAVLDDQQEFVGNQFELLYKTATGAVEHNFLFGLEVSDQSDEYRFSLAPVNDVLLDTLDPTLVNAGFAPLGPSSGDVTATILAPYVVDQMKLTEKVDFVIGLRYDDIETEGTILPLAGACPVPLNFSRSDSELSPMGGLLVAPTPSLSVYGNYSRSYAPPSTRQVDVCNIAGLKPERGTQYEIGAKKQFAGGKYRTQFSVYQLDRDRVPLTDPFTGFTQQTADQRSRGVEIELAAEPAPGLRTFFSYAYNDAELLSFMRFNPGTMMIDDLSGNTPIIAPENVANFWISKSFGKRFGASGGVRFVDEQFINEDNLFTLDSALIVDAAVFYDMETVRLKLNLKNLTDEEYEMRGIAGSTSVIPADPFAAYVSVEYRR